MAELAQAHRVSVVMSVFNGERYLHAAIESILGQTFRDFEFIIVDDASTDRTPEILAGFARQDQRVVLLRQSVNGGYTRGLNLALAIARAPYIARQDADDISLPDRLARQVAYLEAHPAVGVVGSLVELIDRDGRPLHRSFFPRALSNSEIQAQLWVSNCICHGSVLIRRRWLDQVGTYDVSLEPAEDYDLWLRLGEVCELVNLGTPLYQYRYHDESVSEKRRHQQAYYCAVLKDRAVLRRYGDEPGPYLPQVAHSYLAAAIACFDTGETALAHECLLRALKLHPGLLQADHPLKSMVDDRTARQAKDDAVAWINRLFSDLLPRTRPLAWLRSRALSEVHMRAVFSRPGNAGADLWSGVRHNPAWLLNRGVIAILARTVLRRGRALLTLSHRG
jgi:glycosyltransferase involved in cell wall biosynthesis